jgi:heptosyltransferase-2
LLTRPLARPDPSAHRYEYWRVLGQALGLQLPPRERLAVRPHTHTSEILVHSGARLPVRVWPLKRYLGLVQRLRRAGYKVRVACDPNQLHWWKRVGETDVACPRTVEELFTVTERAGLLFGNDSGPGHLAAFCGVPPFVIFGPQLPEWFAPLHPAAEWIEGKACPYKPCSDYCRFPAPHCIVRLSEEEVWERAKQFLAHCPSAMRSA